MNLYQEQLIDHYKNPRNEGRPTWIPTHSATAKNLSCGDVVKMFLSVEKGIIQDISFEGEGCSICIGSASLLTEAIKGMSLEEFSSFSFETLLEIIGIPLTTSRMKCASIGLDAAKSAINTTTKETTK